MSGCSRIRGYLSSVKTTLCYYDYHHKAMQAGSTVAYLSISMLKKMEVMIPDVESQVRFATFVNQVDKSKVVIQKALDKTQLLFDSLMQEYFG